MTQTKPRPPVSRVVEAAAALVRDHDAAERQIASEHLEHLKQ